MTKQTYPGMLDQLVAGGIPAGENVMDALVRECEEEANISEDLARESLGTDAISYFHESPTRLEVGTEFVYELEVDNDFQPK